MKLISSDVLLFEIGLIPDQDRKDNALAILKVAKETVGLTPEFEVSARKLRASGLKPLDALHLAFALASKVDHFCTCDDKFLKKARSVRGLNTKVVSPTGLVMELYIRMQKQDQYLKSAAGLQTFYSKSWLFRPLIENRSLPQKHNRRSHILRLKLQIDI